MAKSRFMQYYKLQFLENHRFSAQINFIIEKIMHVYVFHVHNIWSCDQLTFFANAS